ncbi:hypothetical protein, partial [Marinomonas ostreistagni]
KDSGEVVLQTLVVIALSNKAELVLITQGKGMAKTSIHDAIAFMKDGYKEQRAFMEILNFLIEESTVDKVLVHIDAISDEDIGLDFDLIRNMINTLEPPRKEQAEAFTRFFEDHHDNAKLKEELAQISNA